MLFPVCAKLHMSATTRTLVLGLFHQFSTSYLVETEFNSINGIRVTGSCVKEVCKRRLVMVEGFGQCGVHSSFLATLLLTASCPFLSCECGYWIMIMENHPMIKKCMTLRFRVP